MIYAMVACKNDHLVIDWKDKIHEKAYWSITKNDFGILVVLLDMFIVIAFTIFVKSLETQQKKYTQKYEDEVIEMADFCF